ncbi:MAG: glucosaminidase domain-containing protein [Bacteroidota bacterium]|nr:glucosaminidase domain-containing protein [Bacteroidota bacterium]
MKTKCCHTRHIHVVDKKNLCVNPQCENYLGTAGCYKEFEKLKYCITILVFAFSMLFTFNDYSKASKNNNIDLTSSMVVAPAPLTLENLKAEILINKIICAEEVFAQMKLESANLKSSLLKRTNNMLGMRYPAKRATAACGIYLPAKDTIIYGNQAELKKYAAQNNYSVYATWQDAVADYKLWQESNFKMTDRYLEFLGKVYAEDTLYVSKIRKMTAALAVKN